MFYLKREDYPYFTLSFAEKHVFSKIKLKFWQTKFSVRDVKQNTLSYFRGTSSDLIAVMESLEKKGVIGRV